jgi:hypothetical protein
LARDCERALFIIELPLQLHQSTLFFLDPAGFFIVGKLYFPHGGGKARYFFIFLKQIV